MASWLKAAEDLFEVVDRRAKLVVGEKLDEQPNFVSPAFNAQGSQARKTRSRTRTKPEKQVALNGSPAKVDGDSQQTNSETLQIDEASGKGGIVHLPENNGTSGSTTQLSDEEKQTADRGNSIPEASLANVTSADGIQHDGNHAEELANIIDREAVASTQHHDSVNEKLSDAPEKTFSPTPETEVVDVLHEDIPVASSNVVLGDTEALTMGNKEESNTVNLDLPSSAEANLNDANHKYENHSGQKMQQEDKPDSSTNKVQEELDEAQGLLKTTISTGQSKEARLARVCAGLSSRLQEYKSENAQLEELLIAERELSKSYEGRIQQLQKDLSASKTEVTRAEMSMAEALTAKNSEIGTLVNSIDALKKQAALSEGNLAALQANMESIMRNRELTETRMMQALREELSSAERRAEEERAAHNATKMAAMEREVELEQRAIEASTALARIQRTADDRTAKATELEQKVALLEVECASLNQELQDMEARALRGQKKSPEEANQILQMQAWQEEVERAHLGRREAESKISTLEAEVQKMRVEMAAMKRDAEHYSRQEHMELEKRYRDLTDLLYYKQTQLEAMASEKAAAEFQLEKELKRLQEAQLEVERSRVPRRASSSWEEDSEMKALEPLPLHHRHMIGASIQLQKAAKLLDSGAVRATRFLWRYPIARLLLLFYLVFVHLFLMYLLHRLQEQADTFSSREIAESMGLTNGTLP